VRLRVKERHKDRQRERERERKTEKDGVSNWDMDRKQRYRKKDK
jgi:hypothetical protein